MPTPGTVYVSFSADINPTTTETLIGLCAKLSQEGATTIYLLLSTPGGNVHNGINLYNMLKSMPFKLITHNVASVDSVGNVVFLAGDERYACANATFMFHGVGFEVKTQTRFEEKDLREKLSSLVADQKRLSDIVATRTTLTATTAADLFLRGETRNAEYAKTNGIIQDIRDAQIPAGAPIHQLIFKR